MEDVFPRSLSYLRVSVLTEMEREYKQMDVAGTV